MYQLIAYIKFLFSSTNQHGVHSPFVYNFVTKCLYDKTKHKAYQQLYDYRNGLKKSTTVLKINDFGEGSKVLDKNERSVKKMIKTSSSSKKEAKLLWRIAKYFKTAQVLELGTSLGMGTFALSLEETTSHLTTIEGCSNTSDFSKHKFEALHITNTHFIKGHFLETIHHLKQTNYDLIYFDGHHNKTATIQYFETLLTKANNETIFIFDDIYWSKEMTEAWQYIKAHHAVTVTIDCFCLGLVFFRKEQQKEHFKIRL
ncbi:class I SAM-dependent methyltransferase [uncultured Winogradskyella sp.]|uniref:O-methyltransferase n=1 Tax=uncultured Winogradskyella sp. TaxID=395353 RepID=UPI0030D8D9F1